MGNVIHSNLFVSPISYVGSVGSTSDEQSAWPASNVGILNKPYLLWRSTYQVLTTGSASTSTRIVLDFGSSLPGVSYIVIDHTNWQIVSVSSASNAAITSSVVSHVTNQSISRDSVDGRYKAFLTMSNVGSMGRYVAIWSASTPSPATTGFVGSIACISSVTTMTSNPGFPLVYTSEQAVMANAELAGGGRAPIRLGQSYATLQFASSGHPWSSRSDLFTLARYSAAEPVVVYLNNGDTSQVYICYRVGSLAVSHASPNALALPNGIAFEECV